MGKSVKDLLTQGVVLLKENGDFDCSGYELTSLKGCPKTIKGDFYCSDNKLTSLEECPKKVERNFFCSGNSIRFTEKEIRDVCNVENIVITTSLDEDMLDMKNAVANFLDSY